MKNVMELDVLRLASFYPEGEMIYEKKTLF